MKRAVELISGLVLEEKGDPRVSRYGEGKGRILKAEGRTLPRATPEAMGVESELICRLLCALEAESPANVHSIVICRRGAVIAEASREGYSARMPHLSHSMTKSVCGMLIMLLMDDGLIREDDVAADYFTDLKIKDERMRGVTVRHLLSMSSGVAFNEIGVVTDEEWLKTFFSSELNFTPGEKFAYNSMNTYVLACIADRIARRHYGIDAEELVRRRIFTPLGIKEYLWERSPEGVINGGWGLYLCTEAWARLGIMMMQGGRYRGRQILSAEAVARATSTAMKTPDEVGEFNYGYQIWVSRDGDDFLFNGMLGQNVWVCPKNDVVVALTSGNCELFGNSPALRIIRCALRDSLSVEKLSRTARAALMHKTATFCGSRRWIISHAPDRYGIFPFKKRRDATLPEQYTTLLGEYTVENNNQGLLPAFVRVMQNNYGGGIERLCFVRGRGVIRLLVTEGGVEYAVDFGAYGSVENIVRFGREYYRVVASTDTVEDENGNLLFRFEMLFPEMPNTRRIVISERGGVLTVRLYEIPDERIADELANAVVAMSGKVRGPLGLLEKNLGRGFIKGKLTELLAPSLTATRSDLPDCKDILARVNEVGEGKRASAALIRSLILRLLGEGEGEGFLSSFFGLFGR